ncbi:unnamed protein product [Cylindrotheca closterium]|uniref:Uncharacterized protein n=1 Tax=Cylindrotheca closterium TaxID=2856 RepID=A0AAD2FZ38_9STRA|nr:unnamed protein product [Cylindrotheca closterium]
MMMRDAVAHALIEDLAAGKLVEKSEFQLTEEQKNVRIPGYLIYLAGLIAKPSSPSGNTYTTDDAGVAISLTTRDNEQFESLQKTFANFNKNEMPIFRLSPRLCPTEDQLTSIQTDFERKKQELEKNASKAAEDLLSAEILNNRNEDTKPIDANVKSKTKKKKKKTTNTSNSIKNAVADSNSHEGNLPPPTSAQDQSTSTSAATLEQILSQIQTETTSSVIEEDADPSSWIPVSTKSKEYKKIGNRQNEHNSAKVEPPSRKNGEIDQLDTSHQAVDVTNDSDGAETPPLGTKGLSDTSSMEDQFSSTNKQDTLATKTATNTGEVRRVKNETGVLDIAESASFSTSIEALQERIRLLEQAVKAKDGELKQEKQANIKALCQKQQQFDDQVQALQLRLYISETRLKTFEEALEQHVQAVASNVSTSIECTSDTSGRSILHQYSSRKEWPIRASKSNQTKDKDSPSPLISRLLSRQSKMSDDVPSTGS